MRYNPSKMSAVTLLVLAACVVNAHADSFSLSPGNQLVINFSITSNSSDMLWFFGGKPVTITPPGATPTYTVMLYNGGSLLGTVVGQYDGGSYGPFQSLFLSQSFPGTVPSYGKSIDFSAINSGGGAFSLVVTVAGGTIGFESGGYLGDTTFSATGYTPPESNIGHVTLNGPPVISQVPEPSSLLLLGTGLGGLALATWRRRIR